MKSPRHSPDGAHRSCLQHLQQAADDEARGDLDAANHEYNAALGLEPRLAWSRTLEFLAKELT